VFGVFGESLLLSKGSNSAAAGDRLTEMRKNRRTSCRLDSPQLTRRRNVISLRENIHHAFSC